MTLGYPHFRKPPYSNPESGDVQAKKLLANWTNSKRPSLLLKGLSLAIPWTRIGRVAVYDRS